MEPSLLTLQTILFIETACRSIWHRWSASCSCSFCKIPTRFIQEQNCCKLFGNVNPQSQREQWISISVRYAENYTSKRASKQFRQLDICSVRLRNIVCQISLLPMVNRVWWKNCLLKCNGKSCPSRLPLHRGALSLFPLKFQNWLAALH